MIFLLKKKLYEKDFSGYYSANPDDNFYISDFVQT